MCSGLVNLAEKYPYYTANNMDLDGDTLLTPCRRVQPQKEALDKSFLGEMSMICLYVSLSSLLFFSSLGSCYFVFIGLY